MHFHNANFTIFIYWSLLRGAQIKTFFNHYKLSIGTLPTIDGLFFQRKTLLRAVMLIKNLKNLNKNMSESINLI